MYVTNFVKYENEAKSNSLKNMINDFHSLS